MYFLSKGVLKVRKRVTLMAVVMSTIFGICWLTDSIMYFLAFTSSYSPGDVEWGIATTMIMFNSAVNPLVYGLLNHRFRQKLKRLASCNCLSRNKIRSTNDPVWVLNSRTVPLSELALRSTDQSSWKTDLSCLYPDFPCLFVCLFVFLYHSIPLFSRAL